MNEKTQSRYDAPSDDTSYYYLRGQQVPLRVDTEVFAVGFEGAEKSDSDALSAAARRTLLEDAEAIDFVPHYNLRIYRVAPETQTARDDGGLSRASRCLKSLEEEPAIHFATPAVRRGVSADELSFLTRQFLVSFTPDVGEVRAREAMAQLGGREVERLGYVTLGFLMEAPVALGSLGAVALANAYFESGLCEFAHPDFVERRHWRQTMLVEEPSTDGYELERIDRDAEFIGRQWHLNTARVRDAWAITRGSPAICVAILDDGVDLSHPEFTGKVATQFDFQNNLADGNPKSDADKHGTACAGVAVAAGVKASGVAPQCRLIAVHTPEILGAAAEANMFRWVADQGADVISCSWGPPDNQGAFLLLDNVRAAMHYAAVQGRLGKGIPIFFAAGNGNELVSDDGYASNPDVMAVAASSAAEIKSLYSDFGPEIFVCAPSSGGAGSGQPAIFTTDRRGAKGYNAGDPARGDAAGDYTSTFGGTSSACPLAAGVAALVLSVNPALTRDQVREILRTTADRIGNLSSYDANGHSPQFGYGRVNALRAVQAAQGGQGTGGGIGPSITAPATATSGNAPAFQVNLGNRRLYAVELATRRELLDRANVAQRTGSNYFESWSQGLISTATYRPPANVWSALASSGPAVFYLAHFADDASWSHYAVSASIDDAPSVAIAGSGGQPVPAGGVGLSAPGSARAETAPSFTPSMGGRAVYAVELATSPGLFDAAAGPRRTLSNYYGSWVEGLRPGTPYVPPAGVWSALASAGRVFYRGHFANDSQWSNHSAWPASGAPPSILIEGAPAAPDASGGGGAAATPAEIRYPSGAVFRAVTQTADNVNYSDPVANGIIPLIDTRGRENERLATNFQLFEFIPPGTRYVRISPALVELLQAVRTRVGSLKVESAYRYPAINNAALGHPQSQHLTGRAATVRALASGVRPLDVARAALASSQGDIGVGLGPTSISVDVAGRYTTWVYDGASMTDEQFATWARGVRDERLDRSERTGEEFAMRLRPTIIGPDRAYRDGPPPRFRLEGGVNRFAAVEIAADWRLFLGQYANERAADTFWGSWGDPQVGLVETQLGQPMVFTLPEMVWHILRDAAMLYYRVVTSSQARGEWQDVASSTPDDQASSAPRFRIIPRSRPRDPVTGSIEAFLRPHDRDSAPWQE